MSQENLEAFTRFADANNRRDVEAMLEEVDADVEWHSASLGSLRGEAAVYRGHEGVRPRAVPGPVRGFQRFPDRVRGDPGSRRSNRRNRPLG
jgi:hypothetical protein